MIARGTGDIDMGDEVAQRGFSEAESIEIDEVQEPRRRNSRSDPTSRPFEEHVLTGRASFRSWCAACVQGRGRAEGQPVPARQRREDSTAEIKWKTVHPTFGGVRSAHLVPSGGKGSRGSWGREGGGGTSRLSTSVSTHRLWWFLHLQCTPSTLSFYEG